MNRTGMFARKNDFTLMKLAIVSILINTVLFVVLYLTYIVSVFGMGLGSWGENNVLIGWTLFFLFILLHLIIFTLIARKRTGLRSTFYYVGVSTALLLYFCAVVMF